MILKIPKKAVIFAGVAFILIVAFLLSRKFSSPKTSSTNLTPSQGKRVVREIKVKAKQFEFSPNPLRVKLGEKVRLKMTSIDVTHGFSLPEFALNKVLEPGKEVVVEFEATKKGEFPFFCSVPCGAGHSLMRGRLIVE